MAVATWPTAGTVPCTGLRTLHPNPSKIRQDLTQLMQPIYNSHSAGGRQARASLLCWDIFKRAGADESRVCAKWQRGVGGVESVCSGTNLGMGKEGRVLDWRGFGRGWHAGRSGVEGATAACEFSMMLFFHLMMIG